MEKKASTSEKLLNITDSLPEMCYSFLMETTTERLLTTRIAYAEDLKVFFEYLINYHPDFAYKNIKDITIDDIKVLTNKDINRYISILDKGHAKRTVARKKASISSFFTYLQGNLRVLDNNPMSGSARVKIERKTYVTYLNRDEQDALMNTLLYGTGFTDRELLFHKKYSMRNTAMIFLFLDTGIRISELHGIDIKDLDFDDCSVVIVRKGSKIEKIYFSDEAKSYLQDYLDERRSRFAFTGSEEPLFTTLKGERLSIRQIQEIVYKYTSTALPNKMEKISPHRLRASFAMGFIRAYPDMIKLQKKMGHSSILATEFYAKASEQEMKDSRDWRNK